MTQRGAGSIDVRPAFPPPDTADEETWQAELDARHCRTEKGFLIFAGVALGFPAYYGRNWDAFYECFGDLLEITTGGMGYEFYDRSGRPERTLHLVVRHAEQLFTDATPRDLDLLIWILRDPYPRYPEPQLWHRYAALRTTFVCAPETQAAFAVRVENAGREDPFV